MSKIVQFIGPDDIIRPVGRVAGRFDVGYWTTRYGDLIMLTPEPARGSLLIYSAISQLSPEAVRHLRRLINEELDDDD